MTAQVSERGGPLTRELVIEAASRIVEERGYAALTMRRLSDEIGAAVTAIYWHVGNRETLIDLLVEKFLAEMGRIAATGTTPRDRIASLARTLRAQLLARPHIVALAHERGRTAAMFQPVQAAIADELAALGLRGQAAAMAVRAVEFHVVSAVVLERIVARSPASGGTAPEAWPDVPDDPELVAALAPPPDHEAVFEYGLNALLAALSGAPPARPSARPSGRAEVAGVRSPG